MAKNFLCDPKAAELELVDVQSGRHLFKTIIYSSRPLSMKGAGWLL